MANEPEPEVIRQQMEETRASLTEKLETLEQQVVDTVQGTTTAVQETVASVKDAVQETMQSVKGSVEGTVESVKDAFDLRRQTEQHPWLMVGGAAAAGYVAAHLLNRLSLPAAAPSTQPVLPPTTNGMGMYTPTPSAPRETSERKEWPEQRQERQEPSFLSEVGQTFDTELTKLKGLAIGTLLGVVRDLLARSVPEKVGPQLGEVVDSITTKLGGQPIRGPVLEGDFETMLFGTEKTRTVKDEVKNL